MTPRATPLPPADRRQALVEATLPLLLEHGRSVTTRQIAAAAGVAEGTIFRVFDSKDALVEAVLERQFDPAPFLDEVARIDRDLDLHDRLVAFITLLQQRFEGIFTLMAAVGMRKPPSLLSDPELRRRLAQGGLATLLAPDADRFRYPLEKVVDLVRMLTFSGSHPHISEGRPLSPEEIATVVLHGLLKEE